MPRVTVRAHSIKAAWQLDREMGDWQLDHTFVSTGNGQSWGCFGRDLEKAPQAYVIGQAQAELLFVSALAGDGSCGLKYAISGICHQAANRLLIPAGIDVRQSPGCELSIPLFGKYGLGRQSLVEHIEKAAARANTIQAGSVQAEDLEAAVASVTAGARHDIEILAAEIEEMLELRIADLDQSMVGALVGAYTALYEKRESLYRKLDQNRLGESQYRHAMRDLFLSTLEEGREILGAERFARLFPYPVTVAADYVFLRLPGEIARA